MKQTFKISESFRTSWKYTKSQLAILAGLLIGYTIIAFTLTLFAMPMQSSVVGKIATSIISAVISLIFSLGYLKNIFQALDDIEPQFSAYGQQASKIFSYFFANFIYVIIVLAGTIFLIIPGIYLAIRLQFFWAFIVEENTGVIESLKRSWQITQGHTGKLTLLFLLMIGIFLLGIALFIVGIFIAYPLICMMYCYVFRKLNSPLQVLEDNEKELQD